MITCDNCRFYEDMTGECRRHAPTTNGFPPAPSNGGCGEGEFEEYEQRHCEDCHWFFGDRCYADGVVNTAAAMEKATACPRFTSL